MNKGIAIGVIIASIIIAGGIVLVQNNNDPDTTIIETNIGNGEKAKSFEIGLQESVGITEP